MGPEQQFTMQYSKEESAIVERANKEVMRHLRNIIFDRNIIEKYSLYTPLVQRIMNSSVHQSIGVTPAQLLFGNAIDLDRGVFLEYIPNSKTKTKLSTWAADMLNAQATVINIARTNLKNKDDIHMLTYSKKRTEFETNSYVLVEHRNKTLRRGPKSKLLPFLKGPMRVTGSNKSEYMLQDLITMRIKPYHVSNLRPFLFDPTTQDPLIYALKDEGNVYAVNKISEMRGNPKTSRKLLTFKVHWREGDTTWEPWSSVRRTTALHSFLRAHRSRAVNRLAPEHYVTNMSNSSSSSDEQSN